MRHATNIDKDSLRSTVFNLGRKYLSSFPGPAEAGGNSGDNVLGMALDGRRIATKEELLEFQNILRFRLWLIARADNAIELFGLEPPDGLKCADFDADSHFDSKLHGPHWQIIVFEARDTILPRPVSSKLHGYDFAKVYYYLAIAFQRSGQSMDVIRAKVLAAAIDLEQEIMDVYPPVLRRCAELQSIRKKMYNAFGRFDENFDRPW